MKGPARATTRASLTGLVGGEGQTCPRLWLARGAGDTPLRWVVDVAVATWTLPTLT